MAKKKYKKSNSSSGKGKKGLGTAIGALALSAILLVGGGALGYGMGTHWTYDRNHTIDRPADDEDKDTPTTPQGGGADILITPPEDGTSIINFDVTPMYANIEDTTSRISGYTLTASIKPDDALIKAVNWECGFMTDEGYYINPEWVSGKSVNDYVEFSSSGNSATISMKQKFSNPIAIVCTSVDNTRVSATCRVDCYKEHRGLEVLLSTRDSLEKAYDIGKNGDFASQRTQYPELNFNGINYGFSLNFLQGEGTIDYEVTFLSTILVHTSLFYIDKEAVNIFTTRYLDSFPLSKNSNDEVYLYHDDMSPRKGMRVLEYGESLPCTNERFTSLPYRITCDKKMFMENFYAVGYDIYGLDILTSAPDALSYYNSMLAKQLEADKNNNVIPDFVLLVTYTVDGVTYGFDFNDYYSYMDSPGTWYKGKNYLTDKGRSMRGVYGFRANLEALKVPVSDLDMSDSGIILG